MHGPIFAILAPVLSAAATASVAQSRGQETLSADPGPPRLRSCTRSHNSDRRIRISQ